MDQNNSNKNGKQLPVWLLVVLDLLLTGIVLCVFAVFHHVIPYMRLVGNGGLEPVGSVLNAPAPALAYDEETEPQSWREEFAEYFSEEIETTETTYSSPNISITITEYSFSDASPALTYFVADIYIADVENFQTCFSQGSSDDPEHIAAENQAILALNGDYCLNQTSGVLVRNGELYMNGQTSCDICVLYQDGRMETYGPEEYTEEELLAAGPYQIWKFGPALLDNEGQPKDEFNTTSALLSAHPRSGIGYYEPGHYCFVIVDGRQSGYSDGIDMAGFAKIFSELGCVSAYNLDGGASSAMVFNGSTVNRPCNGGRYVSDMLIIKETEGEDGK